MAERLIVGFEGEGSGVGELTWGQQHIWGAIEALGSPMNMCATRSLAEGATVDEFVDELRYYLNRFQALRTRLRVEPDGRPVQVVVGSGEAALDIVDVDHGADPADVAAAVAQRQQNTPFDYENEFPIREILVRHNGTLTHLVTIIGHVATDAAGGFAMYHDLVHRAASPVHLQPLELAARQRSPAGQRQSDTSLVYWEELLRAIPARRFRDPVDPGEARYWQLEIESPALYLAVRAIAHRTRVDEAVVLLALYAVAVTRVTRSNPAVIQLLVSNRFRPGLADIVSNISQTGLCVVDVAGVGLDEAVARTQRASINAYKYAYFDVLRWKELLARIPRERGEEMDLGCYYNHRPPPHRQAGQPVPIVEDARAALPRTRPPRWTELDYFNEQLMLTITEAPDAITLMVSADTHYVPRPAIQGLVREMETLAVGAAADPGVP